MAVTPSHLLFGCRNEEADFYYGQLWQQLVSEGILSANDGLLTAFSRDQKKKIYVQDRLREHSQLLWRLLQQVSNAMYGNMTSIPLAELQQWKAPTAGGSVGDCN